MENIRNFGSGEKVNLITIQELTSIATQTESILNDTRRLIRNSENLLTARIPNDNNLFRETDKLIFNSLKIIHDRSFNCEL